MRARRPHCPRCHQEPLKKFFTRGDKVVISVFALLFFPVALWIYIRPRHYHCRNCGYGLHARPCGRKPASWKRRHFEMQP